MSERNDVLVSKRDAHGYIRYMESQGWILDNRGDGDDGRTSLVFKRED